MVSPYSATTMGPVTVRMSLMRVGVNEMSPSTGPPPSSWKTCMQVFQDEGGGPVDGDISFTPTLISDILTVTGPIVVAEYGETITAQNLEDRLHYYQQNF